MFGLVFIAAAGDLVGCHLISSDVLQYWAVDTLARSVVSNDYHGLAD